MARLAAELLAELSFGDASAPRTTAAASLSGLFPDYGVSFASVEESRSEAIASLKFSMKASAIRC